MFLQRLDRRADRAVERCTFLAVHLVAVAAAEHPQVRPHRVTWGSLARPTHRAVQPDDEPGDEVHASPLTVERAELTCRRIMGADGHRKDPVERT